MNLSKKFGERLVVDSVSFELEKGEVFGFLGQNGAGKTTTMRMLTCYFPPTSGRATVAGFDIQTQSHEVRKSIGYLPENVPLYPEMTVREYIEFAAAAKGVSHGDRKKLVDTALGRCNLTKVEHQLVSTISRGYRQRVGLAQAIVNQPKVLILDEPTVGLDPEQIRDIRELIKSLSESSTVILSTHILQEVEALCGRVVILKDGRVKALDTPANLNSSLQGIATVTLEVDGPEPEITQALRALQGVRSVLAPAPGKFALEVDSKNDPRVEMSKMIVEKGWGLLGLSMQKLSLEEIFLTLVKDGSQPEADREPVGVGAQAQSTGGDA